MKKFSGWVIKKEYFQIEIDADTWEEAKEKAWDSEIDSEPAEIDWEIYDIQEVKTEEV